MVEGLDKAQWKEDAIMQEKRFLWKWEAELEKAKVRVQEAETTLENVSEMVDWIKGRVAELEAKA